MVIGFCGNFINKLHVLLMRRNVTLHNKEGPCVSFAIMEEVGQGHCFEINRRVSSQGSIYKR